MQGQEGRWESSTCKQKPVLSLLVGATRAVCLVTSWPWKNHLNAKSKMQCSEFTRGGLPVHQGARNTHP